MYLYPCGRADGPRAASYGHTVSGPAPGASVRLDNGTEKLAIMPNGAVRFAGTLWQPPAMMATSVTVPGTWLA